MPSKAQRVVIFEERDGRHPFLGWLKKISDQRAVRKIEARIARIRLGNFGDCKSVGEGVLEIRINYGPGYRVYFGRDGDSIVILLCGGDKSSQKKDIELAKEYWRSYRKDSNERPKRRLG